MKPLIKIKRSLPLIFILVTIYAGAAEFPRLTPEDFILPVRRDYKNYSGTQIIEASLLLSGLPANETGKYIEKYRQLENDFDAFLAENGNPESRYERGDLITAFLHEALFDSYSEFQTRTDVVLDRGSYNCVSSAVFYAALARSIGLEVSTVSTDDHVFCSILTEKGQIDVETTSPYGFDPGTKRNFTDSFGKTGFTYVPPGHYSKRDPGDVATLLSFILQNRISELQKKNNYFESVALSVDRYALLGDSKTFGMMVTEFINYAAYLNKQGKYFEGIDFLRYAGERYNTGTGFLEIYATLVNNAVVLYTDNKKFEEAESLLDSWKQERIVSSPLFAELKQLIFDRKAFVSVNTDPPDEAEKLIDELYAAGNLTKQRYDEFIVFLYGKQAEALGREKKWLQAAEIIHQGVMKIGEHRQFTAAFKGYRNNYAISIHNRFAELYNSKRYQEAQDILEQALQVLPGNGTLQKDLDIVREILSGTDTKEY